MEKGVPVVKGELTREGEAFPLLDSKLISRTNLKKYNVKIVDVGEYLQVYCYQNSKFVVQKDLTDLELKKNKFSSFLEKENQKEIQKSSCLTEEKVISQLEEVVDRCLSKNPVTEWDYEEHCMVETGQWTFDSKGALKAIELLGKHLGMFGKSDNNINLTVNSEDFVNALDGKAAEVWVDEE